MAPRKDSRARASRRARPTRDLIAAAREYLAALGDGATGEALAAHFTTDVVQVEFPNRLLPHGATRDLAAILEGAARGQQVVREQRFDVQNALRAGNQVALEVVWTATLAISLGTLPAGAEMRARFAVFLEFRDGRIARQRNYDCFDPW